MKRFIVVACVTILSSTAFASTQVSAPLAHGAKSSDATDFSARKKMKRMKKGGGMMDKSKMGGEPPSGSSGGGMMKKGM